MSGDNEGLKIGGEVRFTDIVTIVEVEDDSVKVLTDSGFEFWTTRDNLE
ncbi:hypothetical protein [Listeria rustica]|uniref:Uncharacterized protein n=1 Tax=Listeria rustica TaxID=2713503 RepID=A0A7W1T6U7_9LIST|nr:hypothetical protein [Listeria rustica]MBA3926563.1 hypothetical protein [Listeria rustica]